MAGCILLRLLLNSDGSITLDLHPVFRNAIEALKKGWLYVALLVDLGHQGASTRRVESIPSTNCNLLLILDLYENCNFITNVSIICSSDTSILEWWPYLFIILVINQLNAQILVL